MKIPRVLFMLNVKFQGQLKRLYQQDRLKRSISPFLEVGFENSLTAICRIT